MIDFRKFFSLKRINIVTAIMAGISLIVTLVVDIIRINETGDWGSVVFLEFKDVYDQPWGGEAYLNIIAVLLSFVTAIINFIVSAKLKAIQKSRGNDNSLRLMLIETATFMGIGRLLEGLYLLIGTDFVAVKEVILQFYITLDVLTLILFIAMVIMIFFSENIAKDKRNAAIFIFFLVSLYFLGYLMMNFYGLNREAFSIAIYAAFGMFVLIAIITIVVIINILKLRKKVKNEKNALTFIAIQLSLIVITIFILIGLGLTIDMVYQEGIYLPNRLLRVIRVVSLLIAALSYYPAYIKPGLKK